ncbi:universal stress protein [Streptomyces sp. V4-01]|uniref:Universal stress protein n=1 Tax=Actinacidiphila polyblastidii TaxID=3110430 RepID=A0ABU7P5Q8_9ACTN|nr:universal stress protein [Streptomyces sp. V4-01]
MVVVGLDGSDSSWRAAAYAVGLARRQRALLVVLHVLPVHVVAGLAGVSWMAGDCDRVAAARLSERMAEGLGCMAEARSLRWEFTVLPPGAAVAGITEVATARRADTVVVGASVRLLHRLGGAVGARLVTAGRWPVVVVP